MILLIVLLAFILRVTNLNQSLWLDEAINVIYARDNNFLWFISKYPLGDFHPPLYFAILWIWSHIFGSSEISVRLPSVIFGVLTVVVTFLIAREYSKKIALIAALLLAIAPLHIYYSQEARPYALAAFIVSLSFYFFLKIMKDSRNYLFPYILSCMLILYSDYVASLALFAQFIYIILFRKNLIKIILIAFLIIASSCVPWLFVFFEQLENGIKTSNILSGWKEVVGGNEIKEVLLLWVKALIGRISINNKLVYAIVVALISLNYIFLLTRLKDKLKNFEIIFLWLTIPPLSGLLISFFIPVFSYFRFLFILPALYILLSVSILGLSRRVQKFFLVAIILMQLTFSLIYLLNPQFQRENWRDAVKFLELRSGSSTLILFESHEIIAPFKYYSENTKAMPGLKIAPAKTEEDTINLNDRNVKSIYLFEYLVDITDPHRLLERKIKDNGYVKLNSYNYSGVGLIHEFVKND